MSNLRIVQGSGALLKATFEDADGVPSDLDAVPTVVVTDAAGAVVASGNAVDAGAGVYTFALGAQADLGILEATWTGLRATVPQVVRTGAEVAGSTYFTLAELRAQDAIGAAFTGDRLREVQAAVEDLFEENTGVAWVRRGARAVVDGDGTDRLVLEHWPVRALGVLTVGGVDSLSTAVSYISGEVYLPGTFATGHRNVVIEYEHGYDRPTADLKEKALAYARYLLLSGKSRIPDRATLMTTDFGTFNLQTAGLERPTGLPEVDAVLHAHDQRLPGMA